LAGACSPLIAATGIVAVLRGFSQAHESRSTWNAAAIPFRAINEEFADAA